jgi:hypothetical protein
LQNAFSFIGSIGFPAIIISLIADFVIGILSDRRSAKEEEGKETENKNVRPEKESKSTPYQPKGKKRQRNSSKKDKSNAGHRR